LSSHLYKCRALRDSCGMCLKADPRFECGCTSSSCRLMKTVMSPVEIQGLGILKGRCISSL
ncbi:hypothetical protein GOODEAATRI_013636, partial [Goodea atripinnis]